MANILLIEYDQDLRQLLTDIIEVEGHTVASRAPDRNGELREALQEVKPELVVVDIAVPVTGGAHDQRSLDCLVSLRKMPEGKHIPVLAYSIDREFLRAQKRRLNALGATVEEDPVDSARLALAIDRALGEK